MLLLSNLTMYMLKCTNGRELFSCCHHGIALRMIHKVTFNQFLKFLALLKFCLF